jgi:hypothetical protein
MVWDEIKSTPTFKKWVNQQTGGEITLKIDIHKDTGKPYFYTLTAEDEGIGISWSSDTGNYTEAMKILEDYKQRLDFRKKKSTKPKSKRKITKKCRCK